MNKARKLHAGERVDYSMDELKKTLDGLVVNEDFLRGLGEQLTLDNIKKIKGDSKRLKAVDIAPQATLIGEAFVATIIEDKTLQSAFVKCLARKNLNEGDDLSKIIFHTKKIQAVVPVPSWIHPEEKWLYHQRTDGENSIRKASKFKITVELVFDKEDMDGE